MDNPFLHLRQKRNISIRNWAALMGVSTASIQLVESGATASPQKILCSIKKIGIGNIDKIIKQYSAWRKSIVTLERKRLKKGVRK